MAHAPSKNSTPDYGVDSKEQNSQHQGTGSGLGPQAPAYIRRGPAASHNAGNPTSGGGINRPTKGQP